MIRVELNQSVLPPARRLRTADVSRTVRAVSKALGAEGNGEISFAFVTRTQMRVLNRAWRGKDKPTDVLSFPIDDAHPVGEVLICYEVAQKQAKERGHSARQEIIILLVHGLLHAFHYDHEREKDARVMFPLQTRILKTLGIDWTYD